MLDTRPNPAQESPRWSSSLPPCHTSRAMFFFFLLFFFFCVNRTYLSFFSGLRPPCEWSVLPVKSLWPKVFTGKKKTGRLKPVWKKISARQSIGSLGEQIGSPILCASPSMSAPLPTMMPYTSAIRRLGCGLSCCRAVDRFGSSMLRSGLVLMLLSMPSRLFRRKNKTERPQIFVNGSHPMRSNCLSAANHVPTRSVN